MVSGYPKVEVIGAPGFEDFFEAELIMEVPSVSGELMSVVGRDEEIHVIPAHHVYTIDLEMDCS